MWSWSVVSPFRSSRAVCRSQTSPAKPAPAGPLWLRSLPPQLSKSRAIAPFPHPRRHRRGHRRRHQRQLRRRQRHPHHHDHLLPRLRLHRRHLLHRRNHREPPYRPVATRSPMQAGATNPVNSVATQITERLVGPATANQSSASTRTAGVGSQPDGLPGPAPESIRLTYDPSSLTPFLSTCAPLTSIPVPSEQPVE